MGRVPLHGVVLAVALLAPAAVDAQVATPLQARNTFETYCAGCHSERRKTAGMVVDPEGVYNVQADAERWEKVLRKLRAATMPPPERSRPDKATYESVANFLETALDRAGSTTPNAGKLPLLHRLTRTEYQNAVRDLLALQDLPKEMDFSYILPADNAMSGFDNVADLLFVSPTAMESYLGAAEKISALAVGDLTAPVMVNIHRMPDELPQDARVDELPIGTRGGLAVRSHFPLDAEYRVKVAFTGRSTQPQQLEISVDGQRVQLTTIAAAAGGRGGFGGGAGGRGGRGAGVGAAPAGAPADGSQAGANGPGPLAANGQAGGRGAGRGGRAAGAGAGGGAGADDEQPNAASARTPEFRIPLKAGPHLIGVTFIEKNSVRDEETLRPRMRGTGTELALETVTISGPYDATGRGDTPSRRRIFSCRPATAAQEDPCAREILTTLARRGFRRAPTPADVQTLMPFYASGRAEGSFDQGIQRAIQRLLVSPQFLFRIERDPAGAVPGTPHPVTDLELASRLSFFLWSSIPDDELLNLGIQNKLRQPGVLDQQVRRMLADPKSAPLVTNFAEQWLYLRDLDEKKPNEILFPDFDETLRDAFRRETNLFLDYVLGGDRSVLELLSADYTFVNERLAKHYGIPNVQGSDFRKVTFPPGSPRGGLLGQGSILTITSYANRTSPVNRGKWVLENLLSAPPPPPPPNVPALTTEKTGTNVPLTMRAAMIQHRADPVCASCHSRMDPIGFAMENFDAMGMWRDRDAGSPIDTSGVFPNGTQFNGMAGLRQALLDNPSEFVATLSEKLLMYSVGRNVQYFDLPAVRAIVRGAARDNYKFSSLVIGVVNSTPFQMRQTQASPAQPATQAQN